MTSHCLDYLPILFNQVKNNSHLIFVDLCPSSQTKLSALQAKSFSSSKMKFLSSFKSAKRKYRTEWRMPKPMNCP